MASGLDKDADTLVEIGGRETDLGEVRLRGELKRTVFQLRLFAAELRQGEHFDATIDHADADWGMGPRPDLRRSTSRSASSAFSVRPTSPLPSA